MLKILDIHEFTYNYVIQECDFYTHEKQTQRINERCLRSFVSLFLCNLFPTAEVI